MKTMIFTKYSDFAKCAEKANVDAVIIDWENKGKDERQKKSNFEINYDTCDDLDRIVKETSIDVFVRVNSLSQDTPEEVETAISHGASGLILPMAREIEEINNFNKIVKKRLPILVQIETMSLVDKIKEFNNAEWDYSYIGLNDLMLDRGLKNIWESVCDGTVEYICKNLKGRQYGFGGLTVLGGGYPIPIELLIHEYIRLGCKLCFLRRCFKKEILDRNFYQEIKNLNSFIECSKLRGPKAVSFDHDRLMEHLEGIVNV